MSRIAVNKLANRLRTKEVNVDNIVDKLASKLFPNNTAPTTRADGSALAVGDTYFNTTSGYWFTYKGSSLGWVSDDKLNSDGKAANGANSDITSLSGLTTPLSLLQGGTGANTQAGARTSLGLKSAALADIIGTVSQVGGVPTGSILESGTVTTGDYIKWADGTLICRAAVSVPVVNKYVLGALWGSDAYSIAWPMTFITIPTVIANATLQTGSARQTLFASCFTPSTAAGSGGWRLLTAENVAGSSNIVFLAIGRWF